MSWNPTFVQRCWEMLLQNQALKIKTISNNAMNNSLSKHMYRSQEIMLQSYVLKIAIFYNNLSISIGGELWPLSGGSIWRTGGMIHPSFTCTKPSGPAMPGTSIRTVLPVTKFWIKSILTGDEQYFAIVPQSQLYFKCTSWKGN